MIEERDVVVAPRQAANERSSWRGYPHAIDADRPRTGVADRHLDVKPLAAALDDHAVDPERHHGPSELPHESSEYRSSDVRGQATPFKDLAERPFDHTVLVALPGRDIAHEERDGQPQQPTLPWEALAELTGRLG